METKIEIWRVRGIDGDCFASKLDAEIAARDEFPEEGSGRNYSRIYYLRLNGSPLSLREMGRRAVADYENREQEKATCMCGDTSPRSEWLPSYEGDWPRCPACGTC